MLNQIIKRSFSHHARVAIVGAGPAGNSVCAQLIKEGIVKPQDITILDPEQVHYYQPGYTNIAGGVWNDK